MKQNIYLPVILCLGLSACNASHFQAQSEGDNVIDGNVNAKAQCELDPVDYNLNASVYAFEMTTDTNVTFGFNLVSGFFKALGLNFNLKTGVLDLTMTMTDPLHMEMPLVDVEGESSFKSGGGGVSVDLSQIDVGLSFYGQTPLAKLTNDGLANGFANVLSKLKTIQTPWQTKVTAVADENNFIVSVGAVAGLKVGDQFNVYNVKNWWKGSPCGSELLISQKLSDQPAAVVQAVQVQNNAAVLKVISRSSAETIEPGALVEVAQLVKANKNDNRTLLKAVRITGISSQPLPIGNANVDISNYLRLQMGPIVTANGFYLHQ